MFWAITAPRRAQVQSIFVAGLLVTTALTAIMPAPVQAQGTAAQQAGEVRFSIPAQPLSDALIQFGRQSGLQVSADSALTAGLRSSGVDGAMTPQAALNQLLAGTGLIHRINGGMVSLERISGSGAAVLPVIGVEGRKAATAASASELPDPYAGGQVARGGRLGLLGNRDFMDTPLSTTSFTATKIEDQQAATMGEVVGSDPSVRVTGHAGGILDAFFIRGFPVNEGNVGDVAFDGVYGVAPSFRVLTEYAERIEVVKGATALLYGMAPNSAVGGGINIVPKRAGETDLNRVTFDYAQDTQFGSRVDVSRRYGENREFGIRFNGSYHDGDTQLDNQTRAAYVGALAADYRVERFRGSIDLINQTEEWNAPSRPLFLANTTMAVPEAPDNRRNITQSWEWSDITDQAALLRGELDLNDNLTLFANFGGGQTRVDRFFGAPQIQNASGDTSTTLTRWAQETDRMVGDIGLRGKFDTGMVSHTATLQATRYQDVLSRGTASGGTVLSNIYNPVSRPAQGLPEPTTLSKVSQTDLGGVAAADTLALLDERVQLTLGMRHQTIESLNYNTAGTITSSYDDSANTPMAGLVVKPWQHVSFYISYIEGLSKGDVAPSTAANAGEAMAPYVSKQYEAGVKVDFGRAAVTAALFQLTKPSGQTVNNVFSASGEQRNRGLELNAFGEVMPGWRLLGGITLIDGELTKTTSAATRGNRPIGVPEIQANLGLEWDASFLPGLTLMANAVHTGSQYVNTANTQSVPSWTRYDLGARYATTVVQTPATFRLTMRNILDTDYWSGVSSFGGLGQGDPRTVLLSASFDF